MKRHHWIMLALLLGLGAGVADHAMPLSLVPVYDVVGRVFINALKMLVVPLIAASMITAVARMDSTSSLGRMGVKTIVYYLMTTFLAIVVGVTLVNVFSPGSGANLPLVGQAHLKITGGLSRIWTIFERMVPSNVIKAASEGQLLGIITFSLIFGAMLRKVSAQARTSLLNFWEAVLEVMMRMTDLVMLTAPVGVFALVAKVAAHTGLSAVMPLLQFALVVLMGLAIHFFIVLPFILVVFARVSPIQHYRAMFPALLTAFSTSSSMATLSVTMSSVEKEGVSRRVSSFVLPLGATVNMDGTALYESVAALFIAQVYGLHLSVTTQLMVVILALTTSIGVAGVPSASLVAIVIILEAVGLPGEALGLILAVDRPLDMLRTAVNVFSDSCGAVTVAALEGELDRSARNESA